MPQEKAALIRNAAAAIALAALTACTPSLAEAAPKRLASEVVLVGAAIDRIDGEVRSASPRCVGGRTVRVGAAGAPAPLVVAQSDDQGRFEIAVADLPAGAAGLTLTVPRPPPGGQRACRADTAELEIDQGALSGGFDAGAFRGRVISSVAGCVPRRTVDLYEVSSDPVFVGFNFTDAGGNWVIAAAGGTYEARAVPALLGGADAFTYCRALVSPTWVFEEPA